MIFNMNIKLAINLYIKHLYLQMIKIINLYFSLSLLYIYIKIFIKLKYQFFDSKFLLISTFYHLNVSKKDQFQNLIFQFLNF